MHFVVKGLGKLYVFVRLLEFCLNRSNFSKPNSQNHVSAARAWLERSELKPWGGLYLVLLWLTAHNEVTGQRYTKESNLRIILFSIANVTLIHSYPHINSALVSDT